MVRTIAEEELPKTFPELLGEFIVTDFPEDPPSVDSVVRSILTEQYPLLSEDAIEMQRTTQVDIRKIKIDRKLLKTHIREGLISQMNYDRSVSIQCAKEVPDYMKLTMPLFAYTTSESWEGKGTISHEFPWEVSFQMSSKPGVEGVSYYDHLRLTRMGWERNGHWEREEYSRQETKRFGLAPSRAGLGSSHHKVKMTGEFFYQTDAKLSAKTPVTPELIERYIPDAIGAYFQAYAEAVKSLQLTQPPPANQPVMGALWVPSPDSLEIAVEKPTPIQIIDPRVYRDPALTMQVGKDRYVIGLWDVKNEVPIDSFVREWTSGSFGGVKR